MKVWFQSTGLLAALAALQSNNSGGNMSSPCHTPTSGSNSSGSGTHCTTGVTSLQASLSDSPPPNQIKSDKGSRNFTFVDRITVKPLLSYFL